MKSGPGRISSSLRDALGLVAEQSLGLVTEQRVQIHSPLPFRPFRGPRRGSLGAAAGDPCRTGPGGTSARVSGSAGHGHKLSSGAATRDAHSGVCTEKFPRRCRLTPETTTAQPLSLDRVVIRFAGDSGDGMQLTGDRFTDVSAAFGNDLATLPDYPAEIRAPAGHHRRRLGVPGPHLRPRHPHARRPAERARGHEPGGAQGQPRRPARRARRSSSTPTRSRSATSPRPATPRTRSTTASLDAFRVYEVPMTSITLEACKELGVKPRDAERSKNFFALGLISWMYTRPDRADARLDREAVRETARGARGQLAAFRAGFNFGETAELFDHAFEVKPAPLRAGPYRNITGNIALAYGLDRRRRSRRSCRCSTRRTRSRRRPTSSTSCRSTRTSACARCRPRTRSPPSAPRSAPRSRATSAITDDERAGRRPEVRGASASRSASSCRWSSSTCSAAGRRPACRPRPSRPTCCSPCTAATASAPLPIVAAQHAERLLRRRDRGGAHRAQVPHAGDPADRRLPGQRGRAVVLPDVDDAARHLGRRSRPSPTTAASSGRTCAIPRRWPGRGRSRARPG